MPYATLLKPASLRIGGLSFTQGVRTPVTTALAEALEINPRFRVEMRGEEAPGAADVSDLKMPTRVVHEPEEPSAPEITTSGVDLDLVADAIDELDVDDEEAFLDNGTPNPEAVAKILGVEVNSADVAAAMRRQRIDQKPAATADEIALKQAQLDGRAPKKALRVPPKKPHVDDTAGARDL